MIIKNIIEFIFSSALLINSTLFIPQIITIFKGKTANGVSFLTFFGFLLIQLAVVLHGIINQDYLLVTGYILSMATCGAVVILILKYKKNSHTITATNISFAEVIEQLPGHVYWKDKDGSSIWCNTKNWKDFGLKSLSDYIGTKDHDLFSKKEADGLRKTDLEVMRTGKLKVAEEVHVADDGKITVYLSHKAPLRNRYNKIIGTLGISLDLTEERKKETERLEFLENILAVMPGTVYWMNREGIYLGCNDNEAKAIGLNSRKEIVGKRNIDIPGFLIPEALDPVNREVMETGKALLIEEPAILADGTKATFLSNKVPLYNNQGEVVGMVGISFDITEKKRIEQELLEAQHKLEGMTLVRATVAHELRTPLAAFAVAADNIKVVFPQLRQAYLWAKEQGQVIEEIAPDYLNYLEETLLSMSKEIQSAFTLIDISLRNTDPSPDMGKPETLSISEIVDHALTRYPFMAGQRELVQWRHNPANDFLVNGDKILITHVLFNLMKNALYYVAAAGKGNVQIWLEKGTSFNKLYFKDTGTGIASDVLPHIFDLFFTKTDRSAHSAGVGLTFCKKVIESLKGGITCESVEGEYTLFVLSFPGNI